MLTNWSIRVTDRRGRAKTYAIESMPLIFGRDETLPIPIDDPQASRKHTRIEVNDDDTFKFTDMNSTNGTFFNGRKAPRGVINPGDKIKIGETIIEFSKSASVSMNEDSGARKLAILKSVSSPSKPAEAESIDSKAAILSRIAAPGDGGGSVGQLRLQFLAEIAKLLTENGTRVEIISTILSGLIKVFPIDRCAVLLKKGESNQLDPAMTKSKDGSAGLIVSRTICLHVQTSGEAIITEDAGSDPRFSSGDSIIENRIGSVIAAPIAARGSSFGVLYISTSERAAQFSDQDLSFLILAGNMIGLAILLDTLMSSN